MFCCAMLCWSLCSVCSGRMLVIIFSSSSICSFDSFDIRSNYLSVLALGMDDMWMSWSRSMRVHSQMTTLAAPHKRQAAHRRQGGNMRNDQLVGWANNNHKSGGALPFHRYRLEVTATGVRTRPLDMPINITHANALRVCMSLKAGPTGSCWPRHVQILMFISVSDFDWNGTPTRACKNKKEQKVERETHN